MSGVGAWLGWIGLAAYLELFEQQRIELDIIPQLTDSDLKELGIPLGDRKRLLAAIAALADTTSDRRQRMRVRPPSDAR